MQDTGLRKLLSALIRVPSVNPDVTDDPDVGGELRMVELLVALFGELGFSVTLAGKDRCRPNVIAEWGLDTARKTLLVEGHLDTVSIEGMTVPPFGGAERDGRLYGRGACDTKGPIAAFLYALRPEVLCRLTEAGWGLVFIGAIGEEQGNEGIQWLVDEGRIHADEAVVLEPTDLSIVCAHKGALWLRIEVTGRSGHGSDPDRGVSAITGMTHVLDMLGQRLPRGSGSAADLLGPPTVSVGRIHGGSSVNIIPGTCTIDVDRRTLPDEVHEDILAEVRTGLSAIRDAGHIVGFDVSILKDCPPYQSSPDAELASRMVSAVTRAELPVNRTGTAWYSDAGPLSRVCSETIVFGPGSITQAHTADEFIEIEQLRLGARVFEEFLRLTANTSQEREQAR